MPLGKKRGNWAGFTGLQERLYQAVQDALIRSLLQLNEVLFAKLVPADPRSPTASLTYISV